MALIKLRGIDFELHDPTEALSGAIIRNKDFWEADILDYIRDRHPMHGTILDVGANIGNHSVYFANFLQYGSICAMEPIEENYRILERNMEPYNRVGLAAFAVSDHSGVLNMRKHPQNSGAHQVVEEGGEEVPCLSIDKIAFNEVTLIKIDAEWHEAQVLDGATDTIIRSRPLILIEDTNAEYHRILIPLGYEIEKDWQHHNTYLWRYAF